MGISILENINMIKSTIINTQSKIYLFPNYPSGSFGFYDVIEHYTEDSNWRTCTELKNVLEHTYFSLSNIESIIFDKRKNKLFVSFINNDVKGIKDIEIKTDCNKIALSMFNENGNIIYRIYSEYNNVYDLKDIFDDFYNIENLYQKGVIIALNGNAYQVSRLMNFYNYDELLKMINLDED